MTLYSQTCLGYSLQWSHLNSKEIFPIKTLVASISSAPLFCLNIPATPNTCCKILTIFVCDTAIIYTKMLTSPVVQFWNTASSLKYFFTSSTDKSEGGRSNKDKGSLTSRFVETSDTTRTACSRTAKLNIIDTLCCIMWIQVQSCLISTLAQSGSDTGKAGDCECLRAHAV